MFVDNSTKDEILQDQKEKEAYIANSLLTANLNRCASSVTGNNSSGSRVSALNSQTTKLQDTNLQCATDFDETRAVPISCPAEKVQVQQVETTNETTLNYTYPNQSSLSQRYMSVSSYSNSIPNTLDGEKVSDINDLSSNTDVGYKDSTHTNKINVASSQHKPDTGSIAQNHFQDSAVLSKKVVKDKSPDEYFRTVSFSYVHNMKLEQGPTDVEKNKLFALTDSAIKDDKTKEKEVKVKNETIANGFGELKIQSILLNEHSDNVPYVFENEGEVLLSDPLQNAASNPTYKQNDILENQSDATGNETSSDHSTLQSSSFPIAASSVEAVKKVPETSQDTEQFSNNSISDHHASSSSRCNSYKDPVSSELASFAKDPFVKINSSLGHSDYEHYATTDEGSGCSNNELNRYKSNDLDNDCSGAGSVNSVSEQEADNGNYLSVSSLSSFAIDTAKWVLKTYNKFSPYIS